MFQNTVFEILFLWILKFFYIDFLCPINLDTISHSTISDNDYIPPSLLQMLEKGIQFKYIILFGSHVQTNLMTDKIMLSIIK